MNDRQLERLALQLSIWVAFGMALLGLGFGFATPSEAILLDGFFNAIAAVMAGASLWVSKLVQQPDNEYYPFGYGSFEPLVNLSKGLLIAGLSLFALASAINALFHGGRPLDPGIGLIYAAIAAAGCLVTASVQMKISKKINSPLVRVDIQNWLINGAISLSVGIAFAAVNFFKAMGQNDFVPYSDPTLVTVLVLLTLPVPLAIVRDSVNQLVLGAPDSAMRKKLTAFFESIRRKDFPCVRYWLRMTQVGRFLYLHVYWLLPEDFESIEVQEFDGIREEFTTALRREYAHLNLDIIFTKDAKWAGFIALKSPQVEGQG